MKTNIEPGCLCIAIRSGQQCRPLYVVPDEYEYCEWLLCRGANGPWWKLDRPIEWAAEEGNHPYCTEVGLIRIDGHEGEDECEKSSNATPVEA